jgi:hypothetical protein
VAEDWDWWRRASKTVCLHTQGAVRVLLQQEEPSAKIAIAALHPDGPKAAAADARREKFNPRAAGLLAHHLWLFLYYT